MQFTSSTRSDFGIFFTTSGDNVLHLKTYIAKRSVHVKGTICYDTKWWELYPIASPLWRLTCSSLLSLLLIDHQPSNLLFIKWEWLVFFLLVVTRDSHCSVCFTFYNVERISGIHEPMISLNIFHKDHQHYKSTRQTSPTKYM